MSLNRKRLMNISITLRKILKDLQHGPAKMAIRVITHGLRKQQ